MCARKGAELKVIPINDKGHLDLSVFDSLLSPKTRLVAVSHISNVLGIINPVKTIIEKCHSKGIPVLIDGAQGIVHTKVDMKELDCDFYVFSGHKIFAATGTGVLYGRKELLEAMPPYMGGGEMVGTVRFTGTSYAPLPMKFEAGTPNFASVATLKPALEFARSLDVEEVKKNEEAVRDFMLDALMADGQIRLFGVPDGDRAVKIPLFSFCVDGVHHEDLALILDKMGIAVRSGQMCAEPLMDRFGVTGMLRASFAPYNTLQEAEYFIKSLHRAINMLR
jgi:cysteine desulfurase/selenocysteine lyase